MNIARQRFRPILVIAVVTIAGCPLPYNYNGEGSPIGFVTDPSSPHLTTPVALSYSEQGGTSGTIADGDNFVSTLKTTITLSTETENAAIYYTTNGSPLTLTPANKMDQSNRTITLDPAIALQTLDIYAVAIGPGMLPSPVVHAVVSVGAAKVTYNGNGNTGGTVPTDGNTYLPGATVTAAGSGTLSRTAYHFGGWNTQADGNGITYAAGQTFTMGNSNLTLYAHWLLGIEKTAGTGIRFDGTNLLLLTFLAVKAGTEDRSALEYNLTGLQYPVSSAKLDIYISNLDPGGAVGVMDFYTYAGDGVIDVSEFSAGGSTPYTQVNSTGDSFSHVDFTAAVNTALQNGWTYLGVRISTATTDRYWIGGSIVGLPEPILTVVQ